MSETRIKLGPIGELHVGASADAWDITVFERPVVCAVALGRAMFGFTASVISGSPLVEVYLGWPCVWAFWDRHPDTFILNPDWK